MIALIQFGQPPSNVVKKSRINTHIKTSWQNTCEDLEYKKLREKHSE